MRRTKLTEPARPRIRVRELAKEASLAPKDMLALLANLGEYAPNISAFVEYPTAERVRRHLGLQAPPPPPMPEVVRLAPRPAEASPPNRRTVSTGLTPPKPQPPRNNNPLMPEARRPRDDVPYRLTPREAEKRRRARPARHSSLTPPPAHAAFGTQDCSHTMADASWVVYGLTPLERTQWTEAGLRQTQARDAATLKAAGLTPADLARDLDGWTVLERLVRGEGAGSLARRITAAPPAGARPSPSASIGEDPPMR
ncbi:translation initiation factor IF-2 N-terminal domain-containing protein [Arsenicicoccus bolidensis]|uniref:translation initiation factor IF-2 N-terminal domain-containing protein n=1 Tax=Arsenicicoccus bolidensis TaxID=229480 RepID=UPI003558E5C1